MIGEKFGKWLVLEETDKKSKSRCKIYKCKCDCGNIGYVVGTNLRNGHSKSCGCAKVKHKHSRSKLYDIYYKMRHRCYNKHDKNYNNYGGRGIKICDEWLSDFMNFYKWSMNTGYCKTLTIDRIDVNGNYEPNNCRWVDWDTQANNRRNNVYLTYNGKTQTIARWSKELNICYHTLMYRHNKGWSDKECLFGKEV